jgi:hypothetical protein
MILNKRLGIATFALGLGLGTLGCGAASPDESVGKSEAADQGGVDGRLAEYQDTYYRWEFGDKTLPVDAFGNAIEKNIIMMPVPQTPGDGTPGTQDVTLSTGEGFVLPLFGELGTSYRDGTPPDPFEPISIFTTLDIDFSIDGKQVISTDNVLRYYSQFKFNPPIPFDDPTIEAIIWLEGVGILQSPLSPGQHVLKLDEKNNEPGFGGILEYHNTWNVTVKQGQ